MLSEREKRFRKALEGAAQLVANYGDEFLPVFIRLEHEVQEMERRNSAMERARALAQKLADEERPQRAIRSKASRRPASAPPSP